MLSALEQRELTGRGQHIDYSQMEAAAQLLSPAFLDDEVNGVEGGRIGNGDVNFCPHGAYPVAGDDKWIAIACETQEQWQSLSQALGANQLTSLSEPQRRERQQEIDGLISDWTANKEGVSVETELQQLGVPAHRVLYAPGSRGGPTAEPPEGV